MEIKRDILEPISGVTREIGFYLAGLEEVRAQTVAILEDLTKDELAKRFLPGFHQLGGLALHLGECEYWWIQAGIAAREMTEEDIKSAHLYDTTNTDFALKDFTAEDCVDFLAKIHQRSVETLSKFTDDEMDRIVPFAQHPDPFKGTLRWVLHHLIDHEANHKGQMAMIKRLIRDA
jgi:Uncharacterized protein conserved in bacteria